MIFKMKWDKWDYEEHIEAHIDLSLSEFEYLEIYQKDELKKLLLKLCEKK